MKDKQMKYYILSLTLILAACSSVEPTKSVTIRSEPIKKAEPIVPAVDELNMRDVEWVVVTEQNFPSVLARLRDSGSELTLLAVTPADFQNLILNQSDTLKILRQQKEIIAVYKKSYSN